MARIVCVDAEAEDSSPVKTWTTEHDKSCIKFRQEEQMSMAQLSCWPFSPFIEGVDVIVVITTVQVPNYDQALWRQILEVAQWVQKTEF